MFFGVCIFENGRYRRPRTEPEHDELTTKREQALLREFDSLLLQPQSGKGKIKSVCEAAVLFGFELRYKQKRYAGILTLAKRLDRGILDTSPDVVGVCGGGGDSGGRGVRISTV